MTLRTSSSSFGTSPNGARHTRAFMSLAVALLLIAAVVLSGCSSGTKAASQDTAPAVEPQATTTEATPAAEPQDTTAQGAVTELQIKDLKVGTGAEAKTGNTVSVHYTGWLLDGTKFDSSVDRGQPYQFALGAGRVIEGWDKGVVGMKVGGKRELIIPPAMAYGSQSPGDPIPANATLKFEVELLSVQ